MKFTKSNAKKYGRKGGKASAAKRRKPVDEFGNGNPEGWSPEKWARFVKTIKGE